MSDIGSSAESSTLSVVLTPAERLQANRRLGYRLVWIVAGAIAFTIALVPLYDVMCRLTGLNGKTINQAAIQQHSVDETRWVTVEFTSSVMSGLSWNFSPKQSSIRVHPGKIETVLFEAKNMTGQAVSGQAVPSVSPSLASLYLKKIECFCFTKQLLAPGEVKEMPLRFYVSPDLPAEVKAITLSYAFFKAVD